MNATTPLILLSFHGMTQLGLSLPDETWRAWMSAQAPHVVGTCAVALFALRLAADIGICLWILGPERRRAAWSALFGRASDEVSA